ncbi:MAG TPA: hypothetical protein DCX89_00955 [Saprospirales bacterium]|nr:hypothetical protein [Saprospirales bacterium]HAY70434.1 hypothetical protein [Saprospirales bacterium]
MKEKIRIITALLLTVIYGYAVSIATQSVFLTDNRDARCSEQETYLLSVSASIFGSATPKDVTSFNKTNQFSAQDAKKPFSPGELLQNEEPLIRSELSQYGHFSTNLLIQFRKTDKIFPFHYFW